MSYLILIVSCVYAMWALASVAVQVFKLVQYISFKEKVVCSFWPAIRYSVISFAFACLAIYVNHWPKR